MLDQLLDTTAINKRLADHATSPYRWRTGSFMAPIEASQPQLERISYEACKKFVAMMEKQDFTLASKLQVYGPFRAIDLLYQVPVLDKQEFRVRGIFKVIPKPLRIELPRGTFREAPDHTASPTEIMKATGLTVDKWDKGVLRRRK